MVSFCQPIIPPYYIEDRQILPDTPSFPGLFEQKFQAANPTILRYYAQL